MTFGSLVRPLIPSWRFFDRVEHTAHLRFRLTSNPEWQTLKPRMPRLGARLFFNPEGNLALAYQGLVDRLVEEINLSDSNSAVADSATYRLVANIVRQKLYEQELTGSFQFKITVVDAKTGREIADCLISEEMST